MVRGFGFRVIFDVNGRVYVTLDPYYINKVSCFFLFLYSGHHDISHSTTCFWCSSMRQPHQTSDMFPNFKMIFFCIFENVDDLASKCKDNYGAAAKTSKVMKGYVQKG